MQLIIFIFLENNITFLQNNVYKLENNIIFLQNNVSKLENNIYFFTK